MNDPQMNWFAVLVLLSWPVVAYFVYSTQPLNRATLWTVLGGQFLLPVGSLGKIAPGIPPIDKVFIPNIVALLGCAMFGKQRPRFFHRFGLAEVFLAMLIAGPFITSVMNDDMVFTGGIPKPALTWYDAASAVEGALVMLLPFFVGRQFLRKPGDSEELLRVLVIVELLYSIPTLLEVRLSPQLHYWFYGYPAGDFLQQIRNGGYRPMVFIGHGLVTAFFLMAAVVAAAALWRVRVRVTAVPPALVTAWLGVVLVLSNSLGALMYAAGLSPVILMAKPRLQMRLAVILASFALLYPMARMADLVPTDTLLEWSRSYSAEREQSLGFRFMQEEELLKRASQRLVFGWGGYSRSHVYEIDSGADISVTDGIWIIVLGTLGVFGFIGHFGLLTLPVYNLARTFRLSTSERERLILSATALMMAINVVDLIPNSPLMPWTWLMCGSLLGRSEALRAEAGSRQGATRRGPAPRRMAAVRAPGAAGAQRSTAVAADPGCRRATTE